jgi:hypothetical protein
MKYDLESVGEEEVVAYLKTLSLKLAGETTENHGKLQSGLPCSGMRFKSEPL